MSRDARYDAFAGWYDEWVAAPDIDFVAQSLFGLIGERTGERILDVGCGQGRIARHVAGWGNHVVGVDLSEDLLAIAINQPAANIEYHHGDACTTDWWDGTPFDGAVASMSLMDIDDLESVLASTATTLRPGGWFAWSIIHPGFPGVEEIRASWPTGGSYFDEGWWNTGGDGVRGRVGSNHRTLSTYFNGMLAAGFALEAVDEPPWPSPDGTLMPFFLVARWRRL